MENLCDTCQHCRVMRSDRGSIFLLCQRSLTDPAFPKYPRLPVLECSGYEQKSLRENFGVLPTP